MTETTTTTTTVRRTIRAPKPKTRLVKRVRKIVIRTTTMKGGKAVVRRKADAVPMRRVEIIDVNPIRALPTKTVSELTVKERKKLPVPR